MPEPQRRNQSVPGWDTARCHRIIRPLSSLLGGLKYYVTLPSITTLAVSRKEAKTKSDDPLYHPSQSKNNTRRSRQGDDQLLFFGVSRPGRRRVPYTYMSNTRHSAPQVGFTYSSAEPIDYDLSFRAPAIGFDSATATKPNPSEVQPLKEFLDPLRSEDLLRSLENSVTADVFRMYTKIYAAFELILKMTTSPSPAHEAAPLWVLAARKIAVRILTTEDETEPDDDLYDFVGDTGIADEYRRQILRWHAVELVRGAIRSGLLPSYQKNALGLPGVLVGLCRQLNANAEAESLLKTLAERYPLSESITNPWLVTLTSFWRGQNNELCRLLGNAFVTEGNPVVLGNITVNHMLKQAVDSIAYCEVSRSLITRILETAFGIWGKGHVLSAAKRRKELAKRKGERRTSRVTASKHDLLPDKSRNAKPIHARTGERAEDMALYLTEKLFVAAHGAANAHIIEMLENLTRGFLLQDETMRTSTEDGWSRWYPIAAKVTILLQSLGRDLVDDASIVGEIVRCLDNLGEDDLKSLGEFVARCYGNLYSATGQSITGYNEVNYLVQGLISYAATGIFPPNTGSAENSVATVEPTTPFRSRYELIIFTPGKTPVDPRMEKERHYISRLAVNVANGFSSLDSTKHDVKWNQWHKEVVCKVIGLKLRTPGKPVVVPAKERKGWRYEEGISEWVEVGGTPGGTLLETKGKKDGEGRKGMKAIHVEIQSYFDRIPNWRDAYKIFSDIDSEWSGDSEEEAKGNMEILAIASAEDVQQPSPTLPASESELNDSFRSRLFDDQSESSTGSMSGCGEGGECYEQIRDRLPSSFRGSPRCASRIKRSLHTLSAMPPSSPPMRFRHAFTPLRDERVKRRRPTVTFSSPSPMSGEDGEVGDEEVEGKSHLKGRGLSSTNSIIALSSPPLTSEEGDADKVMEEDNPEDEDTVALPKRNRSATRTKTRPLHILQPVKRMRVDLGTCDDEDEDELSASYHNNTHSLYSSGRGRKRRLLLGTGPSEQKQGRRLRPRGKESDDELAR